MFFLKKRSPKKTNSGADAAKIDAGAIDTASAKSIIDSAESKLRLTLKTKFEEKSIDGELDKETFKSVVVDILTEQGLKKMPSAKDLDMAFEIADANNSDSVSLLEFMGFFFPSSKKETSMVQPTILRMMQLMMRRECLLKEI